MDVPVGQPATGSLVPLVITIAGLKSFVTADSSRCAHVENHRHGGREKPDQDQCPLAPCDVEVWNTLLTEEPSLFSCLGSPRHDALPRHRICSTLQRSEHSTFPQCRQYCFHPDVGMQRSHSDACWDCDLPECALVCNTTGDSSLAPLFLGLPTAPISLPHKA